MDEDYARKLRAWLRAEPGATPRRATEEREWFREVPEPATEGSPRAADDRLLTPESDSDERWSVRGQLPEVPPDADDEWVCPVIVLPVPRPSAENGCRLSEAEEQGRRRNRRSRGEPVADQGRLSEAEERSRRQHPVGAEEPESPRRLSEAEARSRWNHPSNWHRRRREAAADRPEETQPPRRTEAEERSRRNHPSNWRPRDEPGSR
jgi:hypothetical protein